MSPTTPHLSVWLPALALTMLGLMVATMAASSYRLGSLTSMGPGFFPLALGIALMLLSLAALAMTRHEAAEGAAPPWRPILAVAAGMAAWALLVESIGFVPASAIQIGCSALALERPALKSLALLIVALCAVGWFIFVDQLGVPLPAFGG